MVRFKKNNGDLEVKMGSRSQELHKAIKKCCHNHISKCPDITILNNHEPRLIDHFDLDEHHRLFKKDKVRPDSRADILLDAMGKSTSTKGKCHWLTSGFRTFAFVLRGGNRPFWN